MHIINRAFRALCVGVVVGLMGIATLPVVAQVQPSHALHQEMLSEIEAAFALRNTDPFGAQAELQAFYDQAQAALNTPAIARSAHYLAVLGYHFDQYAESEAMLDATLRAYREQLERSDLARLELWQGRFWYRLGRVDQARERFEMLENRLQGDALLPDVLLSQSALAYSQADLDVSVEKGFDALRLYTAQNDINGQIQAHKSLGIDFLRIDDLESSLFHFEAGKALLAQSEDVFVSIALLANMGITLQKLGDLEGAMEAYELTYASAVVLGRPLTQAQSLLNIGSIHSDLLGDPDLALDYFARSLAISETHSLDYGVLLNHINIGVALRRLGETDAALVSLDRAYAVAVALNQLHQKQHLLGVKASLLADAGRYQEAFEAVEAQKEIAQVIFDERRDRAIADLRVQYETELSEQALALAETRNLQQSQWIRFLGVLAAFLIAMVGMGGGFLLYRNRTLKALYERNLELLDQFSAGKRPQQIGEDADQDAIDSLFDRLLALIEKEALFKDEQLSLAGLSRLAGSNKKYVSQAISRHANMNFSNFINYYRINEAKKMLRAGDDQVGIADVMLACGFSHKSTFYSAFKKFTGMTPAQFRAMAQQKGASIPESTTTQDDLADNL